MAWCTLLVHTSIKPFFMHDLREFIGVDHKIVIVIPGQGFSGFQLKASLHAVGIAPHSIELMVLGIHV